MDEQGNVNTTKADAKTVLVGSGGSNDVCSAAKDVVVILPQGKGRQVKKVYYTTSPGKSVSAIVTTRGVFERKGSDARYTLTGYFKTMVGSRAAGQDEVVEQIKQSSSWLFNIADDLKLIDPPSKEELNSLRLFDPDRIFLGEIPK